jgi:hypothetical protein
MPLIGVCYDSVLNCTTDISYWFRSCNVIVEIEIWPFLEIGKYPQQYYRDFHVRKNDLLLVMERRINDSGIHTYGYAHTPDSLRLVVVGSRIIRVFTIFHFQTKCNGDTYTGILQI